MTGAFPRLATDEIEGSPYPKASLFLRMLRFAVETAPMIAGTS